MSWLEKTTTNKKFTPATKELKWGSMERLKYSKVIPTGIPSFDKLIIEPFSSPPMGGLPIGRGKITILAGNPGSGKTRFFTNLACKLLKQGESFMYITFERDGDEFVGQVEQLYKFMYGEDCPVEKIAYLDYFCSPFSSAQIKVIADKAKEFYSLTKSPFVAIDSITEMAKMETMLRRVMDDLQLHLYNQGVDLAVVGTSQFRGAYEKGIAGGKGMAHKADAVILIESEKVDNFNKKYYNWLNYGDLVRTISVIKTANYAHSLHKYPFTISDKGVLTISDEPLSIMANKTAI